MANHQRPLSPHLQVYRWQVQMVTSILHRGTGIFLAVSALFIVAALAALAYGPETWACVQQCAQSMLGKVVLFLWTWAFSYHLCNGIRHIIQDFAVGFSIPAFVRSSWLSIAGSFVVTAIIWAILSIGGAA